MGVSPGNKSRKGTKINLHALWDNAIESRKDDDPAGTATSLLSKIKITDKAAWSMGSAEDWAYESYLVAKNGIYNEFNPGINTNTLSKLYYFEKRPIAEQQLEKAGVRLAYVLDSIYSR